MPPYVPSTNGDGTTSLTVTNGSKKFWENERIPPNCTAVWVRGETDREKMAAMLARHTIFPNDKNAA